MRRSVLPLLVSLSPAVVFLLRLPDVVVTSHGGHWQDDKYGLQSRHSCSWKCLLFTLQWPAGFCQSLNESLCKIPPSVNNWTIHGLWPLRAKRCNCWPMFRSDIQALEGELEEYWPSLLKTRSSFEFWREEWDKHGACAACVEGMNSPLRYFQICLKLRGRFDFHKVLEDAGVTPSCERPYKVAEVRSILAPLLGDTHVIQCVKDEKEREVWYQLKIPLSHNLTLGCNHRGDADGDQVAGSGPERDPPPAGHPCPPEVPFYFFPIDHQQPRRPCD